MKHEEITSVLTTNAILEAQSAGRQAAYDGQPVSACPHGGHDAKSRALRSMWVRGYAAARTQVREKSETADQSDKRG